MHGTGRQPADPFGSARAGCRARVLGTEEEWGLSCRAGMCAGKVAAHAQGAVPGWHARQGGVVLAFVQRWMEARGKGWVVFVASLHWQPAGGWHSSESPPPATCCRSSWRRRSPACGQHKCQSRAGAAVEGTGQREAQAIRQAAALAVHTAAEAGRRRRPRLRRRHAAVWGAGGAADGRALAGCCRGLAPQLRQRAAGALLAVAAEAAGRGRKGGGRADVLLQQLGRQVAAHRLALRRLGEGAGRGVSSARRWASCCRSAGVNAVLLHY